MLRNQSLRLHRVLVALDVLGGAAVFVALTAALRDQGLHFATSAALARWLAMLAVASAAWPLTLVRLGLYRSQRRVGFATLLGRLAIASAAVALILPAAAYALYAPVPREIPLLCALTQGALLSGLRLSAHAALRFARRVGRNYRNVLIVGSGPRAAEVRRLIERRPEWGQRIVGYVDDSDEPLDPSIPSERVHKLVDVPDLLREQVVDEVIVACPRSMLAALGPVVQACASAGVPFMLLTDIFGDYLPPPRVARFDTLAALSFAPVHHSSAKLLIKRAVDVAGAAIGLALGAPVLAAACVAIRATSPGPVLFRQVRCGLNGRRFEMLKLRTMYLDAERRLGELAHLNEMDGPVFKIKDDPRITPVGRLLRRYSLDELPQLWNVLRGDMSLVGPRPPIPTEVWQYETAERRRLSMRPGLTCLWQVSGRNDVCFDEWVRMDLEYIDRWSLSQDFKILARTVPAVLFGTGA